MCIKLIQSAVVVVIGITILLLEQQVYASQIYPVNGHIKSGGDIFIDEQFISSGEFTTVNTLYASIFDDGFHDPFMVEVDGAGIVTSNEVSVTMNATTDGPGGMFFAIGKYEFELEFDVFTTAIASLEWRLLEGSSVVSLTHSSGATLIFEHSNSSIDPVISNHSFDPLVAGRYTLKVFGGIERAAGTEVDSSAEVTFTVIPEPGTLACFNCIAAVLLSRRRVAY